MKLRLPVKPYNPKRFSKPWVRNMSSRQWGVFTGDPHNGGFVEFEADAGHFIMQGIRDRRAKHSTSSYFLVMDDYNLVALTLNEYEELKCNH